MDSRLTEKELAEIEKLEREVLPVLRALAEKLLGPDWQEQAMGAQAQLPFSLESV
jgi:hypothetical protein